MMFYFIILLILSILPLTLNQLGDQCPQEFGFLPPDGSSFASSSYIYFYNGIEAQGGSSRFIFPNLTVSCYSKIEKISLLQGLPYACLQARTRYEFELWTQIPDTPGGYELVYRESLTYQQTSFSQQIDLRPSTHLLLAPGDIFGFRNSTINFYSPENLGVLRSVTPTYFGSLPQDYKCNELSRLRLGEDIFLEGYLSPYLNFSLLPCTPNSTEFQISYDWNENTTVQPICMYHRGIYRPICNYFWHIQTADVLCQNANYSHAVIAGTGLTPSPCTRHKKELSEFYWLDYLYCPRFIVDSSQCLRSSWECVSNCSSISQTAAATCAMEEGRTRFVLREIDNWYTYLIDALAHFSADSVGHNVPTVQAYYNGYWQDLSGGILMRSTAEVICKSNGYSRVLFKINIETQTQDKSDHRIVLNCTGSESHTSECTVMSYPSNSTSSYLSVLFCSYGEGTVSLYNNKTHNPLSGELQYSNKSSLAFVCTDSWSAIMSSVVCRELGSPTLSHYRLIPATVSYASQYSLYKQIDTLYIYEASFQCGGDESSLRDCQVRKESFSNSSLPCQKNIVEVECASNDPSRDTNCYSYGEILDPSLGYRFSSALPSPCFFLYDMLATSPGIIPTRTMGYYIQSIQFGRSILVHGSLIALSVEADRRKRSTLDMNGDCLIVYFDSNGAALSVAGMTNRSSLTYSTLYHVNISATEMLTGNLTNLVEPINASSMALVCPKAGVSLAKAYLIFSGNQLNPANSTLPSLLTSAASLSRLEEAYQRTRIPVSSATQPVSPTVQPLPANRTFVYVTIAVVITSFFSIMILTFVCLIHVLRRYYKKEIVTLQVQSTAVVSSVYSAHRMDKPLIDNNMSINNYVQQNVFYSKLKLQANSSVLFLESTKSMRHTIRRVTIVSKYGVIAPEVNYTDANSKRNIQSADQWHLERDKLVYLRELGLGNYGKVQLMEARDLYGHDKLPVAVKTLSTQDRHQTEKFMSEVNLMMSLQNEYIVSLLGFCPPSTDASPLMVLEYMEFGDLKSLIKSYQDAPSARASELNILHLVAMADNIASALVYLAENCYVHRDIAARNCLVGRGLICKLSDFGLTLRTHGSDSSTLPRTSTTVPVKWTAPETFISGAFSFSSDVWSYGVFLWEIFTYGSEPLDNLTKDELISAINSGTLVLPHIPDVPSFCNDLIQMCCFFEHTQRPFIRDVKNIIEGVLVHKECEISLSSLLCSDEVASFSI